MATNYQTGHNAEKLAAEYLRANGFIIHELNWRHRLCEIDIVAFKNNTVYLVEVKYRKNSNQGRGLDYITRAKINQMYFAAEMWVQYNNWSGDYKLAAIELAGENYTVGQFIPSIV